MAWTVEFHPSAAKELKKLGKAPAARIIKVLEERIATLDNPRDLGKPLVGDWRWRMGDYHVIAKIEDERVVILVVCGVPKRGLLMLVYCDSRH